MKLKVIVNYEKKIISPDLGLLIPTRSLNCAASTTRHCPVTGIWLCSHSDIEMLAFSACWRTWLVRWGSVRQGRLCARWGQYTRMAVRWGEVTVKQQQPPHGHSFASWPGDFSVVRRDPSVSPQSTSLVTMLTKMLSNGSHLKQSLQLSEVIQPQVVSWVHQPHYWLSDLDWDCWSLEKIQLICTLTLGS